MRDTSPPIALIPDIPEALDEVHVWGLILFGIAPSMASSNQLDVLERGPLLNVRAFGGPRAHRELDSSNSFSVLSTGALTTAAASA